MTQLSTTPKSAKANIDTLYRIFTIPENKGTTLSRIEKEISENINGFLKDLIVSSEISAKEIEQSFSDSKIPDEPIFVSEQTDFLLNQVVRRSVHTSSPSFIGHMTSALPYFMLPLAKIMIALNQNLVKMETSKAFTPLEKQAIAMLHRLVFCKSEDFYRKHAQSSQWALGGFCSCGTIANLTALWVALNELLKPNDRFEGVGREGIIAGAKAYGYQNLAILISSRGHYSIAKAANLLGIGLNNTIEIPVNENHKMDLAALRSTIQQLEKKSVGIVAVIGIAGTTETGNVDHLEAIADICQQHGLYFHVDAAWGGPTLFSKNHASLLKGIERANSVTIDAHKQLYVPVGAGICLFKSHKTLNIIEHHAKYIIRKGSRDLGRISVEGSRPGIAMLVHSGLKIIGRKGYELLIDMGIEKAKTFAKMISHHPEFELLTFPELNLLTYRYVPKKFSQLLQQSQAGDLSKLNQQINRLTVSIQKEQRENGKTFVSRTSLRVPKYGNELITVFRTVLANPLTTTEHLSDILEEQKSLGRKLEQTILVDDHHQR